MPPKPTKPFNDDTLSIIHATVGIAAADGGPVAARAVAAVIDHVAHCVASVPAADAQVTANVISNIITNYVTAAEKEPGLSIAAIYEQARDCVPESSIQGVSNGLPEALGNIRRALSYIDTRLPDSNLAAATIYAVARVTNSVARISMRGCGRDVADTWSDAARRTVIMLSDGVRTGSSTRALPDRAGGGCSSADTGTGTCEAVLQTAKIQAAIGALSNYGENAHALVALNAIDAVAAKDHLPHAGAGLSGVTRCTCNKSLGSCKALLQANRLRAALSALLAYNTNVGNYEVVGGLSAVATAAGLQPPLEDNEVPYPRLWLPPRPVEQGRSSLGYPHE
ncbi:uncharacterized protein B0H64DRAFT_448184 [Chaetomium fimeti]|uniref:Uncharacterized protein n=1 Tax=Chaetomium fimeti TaxID=1854472 RepID=A0AAE0HP41_9PEZI|nr:hypothetical protein B0H64DRAFT_448184 [Chaetomium fimeti]